MSQNTDDDPPCLSAHTMLALQEFYKEQEVRDQNLLTLTTEKPDTDKLSFDENWQLSQFWYDDITVDNLVKGALQSAGPGGKIALISCPTLYNKLSSNEIGCQVTLFEYDKRFAVFGNDYKFYDYKSPLDIPRELVNYYDVVLADPPFLSEECLTKTAVTIKYLAKNKIVLCTGAVMAELAQRLLDLKKCTFVPHHKNNLANEFWCFANFDFDSVLRDV